MKNWRNKLTGVLLASALAAGTITGCGAKEEQYDGSETAVQIDGEEINLGTANFMLRYQQAMMENYNAMIVSMSGGTGGGSLWDADGSEKGTTYGEEFKDGVLDTMQQLFLIRSHADEYQVTLTEEEKNGAAEAAKAFMEANTEETLGKLKCTEEDVKTIMELYAYQNKVYEAVTADVDTNVTDEEAKKSKISYVKVSTAGTETDEEGNTIELTEDEKAAKKETAEKVLEKIRNSENPAEADMDALAKEVDETLSGVTTVYDAESTNVGEELQKTAANLTDGQVCEDIIEQEDGYYVLRLDAALDREATDNQKQTIISERKQEMYDETMESWVKESKTEALKPWKSLKVTDEDTYAFKVEVSQQETGEETEE